MFDQYIVYIITEAFRESVTSSIISTEVGQFAESRNTNNVLVPVYGFVSSDLYGLVLPQNSAFFILEPDFPLRQDSGFIIPVKGGMGGEEVACFHWELWTFGMAWTRANWL